MDGDKIEKLYTWYNQWDKLLLKKFKLKKIKIKVKKEENHNLYFKLLKKL